MTILFSTGKWGTPRCNGCGKSPAELREYVDEARATGTTMTPDAFVSMYEGTYNPANGHFLCTPCYSNAGMPSSPTGWIAP